MTKTTSKPNGSDYFERIGNHVNNNCTVRMQICQFSSMAQSSIFARELRKYSQNLKAFGAGRVPCKGISELQRKGTPPSENPGTFRIDDEDSHDILYKMHLLVSPNITRNIVNVWKSNLSDYLLGRIRSRAHA